MGEDGASRPPVITTGYLNNRLKPPVVNRPQAAGPAALRGGLTVPTQRAMSNNSTRQKVVLKPGHSALDWESTKRGAAFRNGMPMYPVKITADELKRHNTLEDYWIVINRRVYNLTPYLDFHPGGVEILRKCAGRDGTALFNKYHPWINAERILDACLVGFLV